MPLSLYFKDGRAKVELALARGKKSLRQAQALAERTVRERPRELGRRAKGPCDGRPPPRCVGLLDPARASPA